MEKRQALGKGLSALIPDAADVLATPRASLDVDIDLLEPNDLQPRAQLDDAGLDDLTRSIRANGVIQPIVARRLESGRYQIIAGERRWRAAQRAGLQRVPIVVKDIASADRRRRLELALIPSRKPRHISDSRRNSGCGRKTSPRRLAKTAHRSPTACAF
jgi:ParB family transcriptional regulator, chromosome partitioning protein